MNYNIIIISVSVVLALLIAFFIARATSMPGPKTPARTQTYPEGILRDSNTKRRPKRK